MLVYRFSKHFKCFRTKNNNLSRDTDVSYCTLELLRNSIARIPEAWKCFLDPDSWENQNLIFALKHQSLPWIRVKETFIFFFMITVRECAQSIPRLEKPKNRRFSHKNPKIFRFSLQYTHHLPWIRVKEAFSRFGNARNRFFAWFYPYLFWQKNFSENDPQMGPPLMNFSILEDFL